MGLMGIVLLSSCDAQLDQVNPNAATEETSGKMKQTLKRL